MMLTKVTTSDINALVLDYLTVAGYPNAAARFSTEANLQPQQANSEMAARQEIQSSIHKGDIVSAIGALNDLDPSVSFNHFLDLFASFAMIRN
jgi:glucose-induced degradation protein 8